MIKFINRRLKSKIIRLKKSQNLNWLHRWQAACNKIWIKFSRMPVEEKSLKWMEKHHNKLMKLSVIRCRNLKKSSVQSAVYQILNTFQLKY